MRIVYKKYAEGGYVFLRTEDDGSNPTVVEGKMRNRSEVKRVPIFIEVSCDERATEIKDARSALRRIGEILNQE